MNKSAQPSIEEMLKSIRIPDEMTENTTVKLGDCKERVAFELTELIGGIEKKATPEGGRKWMLDLYSECLDAVEGRRRTDKTPKPGMGNL